MAAATIARRTTRHEPQTTVDPRAVCQEMEDLFRAHSADLRRYLMRRVGCAELAQDLTSEVFVEACNQLNRRADAHLAPGWFYITAQRRLIDHWRRLERSRTAGSKFRMADPVIGIESPLHDDELPSFLVGLPERQCRALELRYGLGLTVAEVAEVMDESYRTVESLLARGRRNARQAVRAVQQ